MTGTKQKPTIIGKAKVSRITLSPKGVATAAYFKMSQREAYALCGAIARVASSHRSIIVQMFGKNRKTLFLKKASTRGMFNGS